MSPGEKRERLRRFDTLCRERGYARTAQRRRILELILDRRDHPTADQIYDEVRRHLPRVSRMTVYRVLDMLIEIGEITKVSSPGAATRFDPMIRRHHHLVCMYCDCMVDIESQELDAAVQLSGDRMRSFDVQDFSIHFSGICAACRRKRRKTGSVSDGAPSRTRKRSATPDAQLRKRRRTP